MAWTRKNPFWPDEDAADFMVTIVAREAEADGKPLTDEQQRWLRSERPQVPTEFAQQAFEWVTRILNREVETGESENARSFNHAIEWAGDQEYPFVVQLAERFALENRQPEPLSSWLKDRILLVGCAVGFIIVMMVVAFIANWLSR